MIHAVAWQEYGRLPALLKRLAALHPSARLLSTTGVGFLVADRRLWGLAGTECQILSQKVASKWRAAVKTGLEESSLKTSRDKGYAHPFSGLKAVVVVVCARVVVEVVVEVVVLHTYVMGCACSCIHMDSQQKWTPELLNPREKTARQHDDQAWQTKTHTMQNELHENMHHLRVRTPGA